MEKKSIQMFQYGKFCINFVCKVFLKRIVRSSFINLFRVEGVLPRVPRVLDWGRNK